MVRVVPAGVRRGFYDTQSEKGKGRERHYSTSTVARMRMGVRARRSAARSCLPFVSWRRVMSAID